MAKNGCSGTHRGKPVKVGEWQVLAGAGRNLKAEDLRDVDIVLALAPGELSGFAHAAVEKGWMGLAVALPMRDFGCWDDAVLKARAEQALEWIRRGYRVLVCCMGGHGRTGTFIAAMIALAEPGTDPIEAVRARHCNCAVEAKVQAEAIFACRGETLPERWKTAFSGSSWYSGGASSSRGQYDLFGESSHADDQPLWWREAEKGKPLKKPEPPKAGEPIRKMNGKPHINVGTCDTGKDLLRYVKQVAQKVGIATKEWRAEAEKVLMTGTPVAKMTFLTRHFHVHK